MSIFVPWDLLKSKTREQSQNLQFFAVLYLSSIFPFIAPQSEHSAYTSSNSKNPAIPTIELEILQITLHTAAEPAVRATVKTYLSYRNDTNIACFVGATKSKDNTKIALASSKS